MHTYVLQDWLYIKGGSGVSTITQAEHDWLDLEEYQDVVFWLSCNEASGTALLSFQTSPTADDSLFTNLVPAVTLTTNTSVSVTQALLGGATVPVARFVRWQVNGTAPWDASMRILVSANAPGL